MMSRKYSSLGSIGILTGALLMQSACSGDDTAQGSGKAINRTTHALTSGEVSSVNGTYSGCRNRSGSWSIRIGGLIALDNPQLSVILNDTACALTMTALHTTAGVIAAAPSIPLTASYSGVPSAFNSPIEFYADAKLSSLAFAANFDLTVLYSDDLRRTTASNIAALVVVTSAATSVSVPAPDYTLNVDGLALMTDVNDVVQSATGTADLTAVSVAAQTYVVVNAAGLFTYAAINTAYLAGSAAFTANVPAVNFALVGTDLTGQQVRTLIVANTSNGVRAYQAFQVTFFAAP
jgi:hypothetical protein